MKVGIYSGTFDPPTNGHLWLISEASKMFDKLYVLVGTPERKNIQFGLIDRVDMLREIVPANTIVAPLYSNVISYANDYIKEGEIIIIRGIRDSADLDYESSILRWLRRVTDGDRFHFVFIPPPENLETISSSVVKDQAKQLKWDEVAKLVPPCVYDKLIHPSVASIFETTTAGFGPVGGWSSLWEDGGNIINPKTTYLGKTRSYFEKAVENCLFEYAQQINHNQVRGMLDESPYDVIESEIFDLMSIDMDKVAPFGEKVLPCSQSLGPIIVDRNCFLETEMPWADLGPVVVIEGKHRWFDAKERGDKTIMAWVGNNAKEFLGSNGK